MYDASAFDEIAESHTLAAAGSTTASPLAEVAATPVTPVMEPETNINTASAAVAPAAPMLATAATVAAPTSAPLGTLPSSPSATLPMLGALLLVVGLILVLGKLVKRVQGARAGQGAALSIKGGVQVGSKERVVWMQAGDTHLLLGVSAGRVQTLHVFDVAPDFFDVAPDFSAAAANEAASASAANTPATKDFSERLKTLLAHARTKGLDTEAATLADAAAVVTRPAEPARAASSSPSEPMRAAATKPLFSFRA